MFISPHMYFNLDTNCSSVFISWTRFFYNPLRKIFVNLDFTISCYLILNNYSLSFQNMHLLRLIHVYLNEISQFQCLICQFFF